MKLELWRLLQMEHFARVVNGFKLLTIFAERFVLHVWWSPESASTYYNLLVFYGYVLLLLLYLYVVAISYLFRLTTITSVQHSTEPCIKVVVVNLRGIDRQVYLYCYCWSFSCQCFSCGETSQLICIANRVTAFYVRLMLAWEKLNIYSYYLVIINLLSSNCKFVTFL